MVDGIYRLTHSDLTVPTNIGNPEYVTVDELVRIIADISGKQIRAVHVEGPVGVLSRNFSNERIYSTGWRARFSLRDGIGRTYPWVEAQVRAQREAQVQPAPAEV
jgi:nucleoside-diphosphate-sugar epimerase